MAAISGFDYSLNHRAKVEGSPSYYEHEMTLDFGNGSDTYPTGGIPLDKQGLGLPNYIRFLNVIDSSGDGFVYKYDAANEKIMLFVEDDNASELVELANSETPQSTIIVQVAGY